MGILQRHGMSCIQFFTNEVTGPYMLRPDSQSLPNQTFNETVATAIGHKSGIRVRL